MVVSYFEQPLALEALLVGLRRQTYPRELFEVIVVDDGSATPLEPPDSPLAVRVIRQAKRGFGLARARNNGARAAAHDILVFLDGDVLPDAGLLAAHARWHHAAADALTLGFRARADRPMHPSELRYHRGPLSELYGECEFDAWRVPLLARSGDLTTRHDWVFGAMAGANFAMRKTFYEAVGGCNETFTRYGGEDTELAYRAHSHGGLLIPARDARVWHPAAAAGERARKASQAAAQHAKLADLIPHPSFRDRLAGGPFPVPKHVITLQVELESTDDATPDPADRMAVCIRNILERGLGDLVIRVARASLSAAALADLAARFAAEPRVQVAPARSALDQYPASPFHIRATGALAFEPDSLIYLKRRLGPAVSATLALAGGGTATITRAWALHRARRTGLPVSRFGRTVTVSKTRLRSRLRSPAVRLAQKTGIRWALRYLLAEARCVTGPGTAKAFLSWVLGGALNRRRRLPGRGSRAS